MNITGLPTSSPCLSERRRTRGPSCLAPGQQTPDGYYNLERMLKPVLRRGG